MNPIMEATLALTRKEGTSMGNDEISHKKGRVADGHEESKVKDVRTISYSEFLEMEGTSLSSQSRSVGEPEIWERLVAEAENPFACYICKKRFKTLDGIQEHTKLHDDKPYVCDVCNKRFKCKSVLKTHAQSHSSLRPFVCHVCFKGFTSKSGLRIHSYCHTKLRPYVCKVCEKSFRDPRNLREHAFVHLSGLRFSCNNCGIQFKSRYLMRQHVRSNKCTSISHSCTICDKSFNKQSSLKTHMNAHSKEKSKQKSSKTQKSRKKTRNSSDKMTSEAKHYTEKYPYQCQLCLKRYLNKKNLRHHKCFYTSDLPLTCYLCATSFMTDSDYVVHTESHA